MRLVRQPPDLSVCGQCCIAMAAGVSLERAVDAVGHRRERGMFSREFLAALTRLGVEHAGRWRRMSRTKPVLPRRCIVWIANGRGTRGHALLSWDGTMYDPGERWPDGYRDWRITSYLEIHS